MKIFGWSMSRDANYEVHSLAKDVLSLDLRCMFDCSIPHILLSRGRRSPGGPVQCGLTHVIKKINYTLTFFLIYMNLLYIVLTFF